MSTTITKLGKCGIELPIKLWKQGGSVKCKKTEQSIVSYPQPTDIQLIWDVIELCEGCEFTVESKELRTKQK